MGEKNELRLPDLHISGFRGIDNLDIPRLGRVTLLVGKNGVGKTTVLDAVRVYAARGSITGLADVLDTHDEKYVNNKVQLSDWKGLFAGRLERALDGVIQIGTGSERLTIKAVSLDEEEQKPIAARHGVNLTTSGAFRITFSIL